MQDDNECEAQSVLIETPSPGLRRVVLNRPDKLNALTESLLVQLHAALTDAARDPSVRCVLLSGAGRAFCAGQDLNDRDPRKLEQMPDLEEIQVRLFHPVIKTIRLMPKPVIAAVHGIAAGAGTSIALAADMILAARSTKFILSFSKVGLSVDAGAGWHLAKALGSARARGLLLTGGALGAKEAAASGLIWQVIEDEALEDEAIACAKEVASGPTQAFSAIKSAISASENEPDFDHYLEHEAKLQGATGRSNDYREGILAFLEKRAAQFQGE